MVAILFSQETGFSMYSFQHNPHLKTMSCTRYKQRHRENIRITVGVTEEMEKDRFFQPDPSWFSSSYWVYKFQSPPTTEGEKHDYHITQSSATLTSAQ